MTGCKVMAVIPIPRPTTNSRAGRFEKVVFEARRAGPIRVSYAVAYSGGADSTALLLMLLRQHPGRVHAIHIHHGLQAAADDFAAHCTAFCAARGVPLQVVHVNAKAAAGQSPEDAARRSRYAALTNTVLELNAVAAQEGRPQDAIQSVAIAHHADDQAETLLLALSRGAGLPGLSAMPARWHRDGLAFERPLLDMPASEIRAWLAAEGLVARHPGDARVGQGWVEDPSNRHDRHTRNRIRHGLLPAIEKTFPQFRQTFARSARHAAQAQALLLEIALEDLVLTGVPPAIAGLQKLTPERQANALRCWLKSAHGVSPSAAQLDELQKQIAHLTNAGRQLSMKVGPGSVQRQGGVIVYQP